MRWLYYCSVLKYGNRLREIEEVSQMAAYDGGVMVTQCHLELAQTSRAGSLIHPECQGISYIPPLNLSPRQTDWPS